MNAEYIVLDTETGGLSAETNPLLSISVLAVQREGLREVDRLHLKIKPPEGTLLEVTTCFDPEVRNPPVDHLVDAAGVTYPCSRDGKPHDPQLRENMRIAAGAARVNGFTWDTWCAEAISREQADATFRGFISSTCVGTPTAVAHNAVFDEGYVRRHLPGVYLAIAQPWMCTMKMLKTWRKLRGVEGRNRLLDLAELANNDPNTPAFQSLNIKGGGTMIDKAHDALADTILCHAGLLWLNTKFTS